jgi:hypothetical protein
MAVRFLAIDLILALPHRSMQPTRCAEGAGLDGGDPGCRTITCAVHYTDDPVSLDSTGVDVLIQAFATLRIYTRLSGTTNIAGLAKKSAVRPSNSQNYPRRCSPPKCTK